MSREIEAEIVGCIIEMCAWRGDPVGRGDVLLVMESMKMEIPVVAEDDGVVDTVAVAVGDVVRSGDLLLTVAVPDR